MALFVAFADSEVASVARVGTALHIRLAAAAALSAGEGPAPTHGHVAGVTLVLGDAVVDTPLHELLGRIAAGRVELGGRWLAQVALPSDSAGPVRLELAFANRGVLAATGGAFTCRTDGTPRFTESLAC
jgi:hypothetical protein